MSYEPIRVNSDDSATDEEWLYMYIYPNKIDYDNTCENEIADALADFGDGLLGSVLHGYTVNISYEHPDLEQNQDAEATLKPEWSDYSGPNSKEDHTGVHLLVYEVSNFDAPTNGHADNPENSGGWTDSTSSVLAIADPSSAVRKQIAIHEVAHNLIDQSNSDVQDMMGDDNHDHELGQVYSGVLGDGPVSPMATGYTNAQAWQGDCQSNAAWNQTYNQDITNCTHDALKLTSHQ